MGTISDPKSRSDGRTNPRTQSHYQMVITGSGEPVHNQIMNKLQKTNRPKKKNSELGSEI